MSALPGDVVQAQILIVAVRMAAADEMGAAVLELELEA